LASNASQGSEERRSSGGTASNAREVCASETSAGSEDAVCPPVDEDRRPQAVDRRRLGRFEAVVLCGCGLS